MAYTVKKLAELSGVSVRTLHFYDEIGLLKPAFCGDNRYRYYEEEQLLMLQQILFFRELGLPLNEIQRIITSKEFDKIKALKTHRAILEKQRARTKELLAVIDKTINHLEGNTMMKPEEFYHGFDPKQKDYETYLRANVPGSETYIEECNRNTKSWTKADWEQNKQQSDDWCKAFAVAYSKGQTADSAEIQKLIKDHYTMVCRFYTPTKQVYLGLADMYLEHPDFRAFYDAYQPGMLDLLAAAMRIFAGKNLK